MESNYHVAAGNRTVAIGAEAHKVLRNTYLLLALTMIPTLIGVFIGLRTNFSFMAGSPIITSLVFLGVFYGLLFAISKNQNSIVGIGLLFLLTFALGFFLGPLLQVVLSVRNGGQLVTMAAGGTALTFFGLAGYVTATGKDFSGWGRFLGVGIIVVMLAVIANIFLQIPALSLTISAVFVFLSSMLILYDVSRIVNGGETNYVMATLALFIDIYNLFSSLLHLLFAFFGSDD